MYIAFPYNYKPIINGASSIKHTSLPASYMEEQQKLGEFNKNCTTIVEHTLLHGDFDNTLFVGISKNARVEEIEQKLKHILKIYITPKKTRMRPKEWRYYLLVFDLIKNGKSISETIDILIEAFPDNKKLFDEKNINNYYINALALIDGGYKKYLTYTK